ncbi:CHAT domain-containing protein [Nocardioides carbamazepini]|uniref:CHAT domain-containing protein n=1 Tax=Nocardioides carbamazepini TaxID=2854259 RepID=UPI00214A79BE|nr:CHAT domain-containing protein [Nocardioides carbamazepini]MCR1782016.1 CHAT domain-containing protein [Nocardioides carbamazepini]
MSIAKHAAAGATAEIDELIREAESWLNRDAERCRALIECAEAGLNGQRDAGRLAWINMVRGDLAVADGELGAAASAYRNARRNWLAADRSVEAVRAAVGVTQVQLLVGEFEAAEAGLKRLQAELGRVPHEDAGVARLGALVQRQLADARAGRGQVSAALRQYDAAENLFGALGDSDSIAQVQLSRGRAALDAGLMHNALLELNRARVSYQASGQGPRAAAAAALVAEAFSATGQVARALDVLDCLAPELPGTRWHVALHALVRSDALLRSGFAAEAHAEACAAEEVFMEIGAVECSARAALACARASLAWGRRRAAASELEVAERLFGDCGSRLMRMHTWLLQAEVAWALGEPETCRAICDRVVAAEVDDTPAFVTVRARVLAARVAEPDAAAALLDAAAARAAGVGTPELRADVLLARARHERRTGQVAQAVASLHRVLSVGRGWAQRLGHRGSVVCPSLTEATEELILLLLERGDHAGRVEALRRARAAKAVMVDPQRAAGAVGARSDGARGDGGRRLERLLSDAVAPITVVADDVDEALPAVPDGSLIEYYVAGDDIVVFVVRDGHVDARVLSRTGESTRRLVNAWQQECTLMAPGGRDHPGFTSSAALDGLFDLLLAPVVELLADLDDELHVVGHRHLHAVPFDALLDEVGPWYASLARPLLPPERVPSEAPELTALVLAVPDDNAPSITREAEMILRFLPTAQVLVAGEATRGALVRRSAGADVVHLACHGVFHQDDPLSSGLRLADGWLRARDIATGTPALDGAVVVLSACSSGRSSDHTSEPVGLVSACLAAGARGVVAALWVVDDEVTLELMTHFYRALAAGAAPSTALRQARRQVARRYPHPYYWGAFRFVGRTDAPR